MSLLKVVQRERNTLTTEQATSRCANQGQCIRFPPTIAEATYSMVRARWNTIGETRQPPGRDASLLTRLIK